MGATGARLSIDESSILADAFHQKPAAAIEHLRQKGYAVSWNWHETWQQAHTKAFTVAKVARMDVLQDIRGMVAKATEEGWTYQQFAKQLEPQLQAKGWWGKKEVVDKTTGEIKSVQLGSPHRLKTIYDTNLRTQYAQGHWDSQWESRNTRPYIQMLAVRDKRTTEKCRSLDQMIFRIDDPIIDHIYPPNHFHCRLTTRSISQKEMDRRGLPVESTEGKIVQKEVLVGGEKRTVTGYRTGLNDKDGNPITAWTEPGWDYNPGKKAFAPDLSKYDSDIAGQFKKMQDRQMELPTPGTPILERFPVKREADVAQVLTTFQQENPAAMPRGSAAVTFTRSKRFLMATDTNGQVFVSAAEQRGFNPKTNLVNAMKKISAKTPLSFNEEYSLESFWHEILHNTAKGATPLAKYSLPHVCYETLNQYVARHTYPEFVAKLGGKAAHASDILANGLGYKTWVANFRTLLGELGVNEKTSIGQLRHVLLNQSWNSIPDALATELAVLSKKSQTTIKECFKRLRAEPYEFGPMLKELLK